jgi:hypothetical protein
MRRSTVVAVDAADPAAPALRTRGRRASFDVEQVLERDGQTGEAAASAAAGAFAVGGIGATARLVRVDLDERVQLAVERGDPVETGVDDVA